MSVPLPVGLHIFVAIFIKTIPFNDYRFTLNKCLFEL